ncbi:hypothetical protein QAD02_005038 [Eretmocerus hayati]|uniref:Uncharacterized protein n=1 Tax=Eretmocerus hayati TaxID=131215 RepID=A0ACC2NRK9_9HYME|nr:hypothetical protein QAD02_005038 [Eretmocerus hayati]
MAPRKPRYSAIKSEKNEKKNDDNKINDDSQMEVLNDATVAAKMSSLSEYESMFTSDKEFHKYENDIGSTTASFVGIVVKKVSPSKANNSTVAHVVLSNHQHVEVQISGWGHLADQLEKSIADTQKIIWAQGLTVVQSNVKSKYFYGNTNISFKMTSNTVFEELGTYDKLVQYRATLHDDEGSVKQATLENILNCNGMVCVRGYVRNPFKLYEWKYNKSVSGTITNGRKILAVNIKTDQLQPHIHLGHDIEVIGYIEEDREKCHMLSVNSPDNIKLLSERKIPLETIMHANEHI